jgi:DNA-binding MarR family transcriptional regulator
VFWPILGLPVAHTPSQTDLSAKELAAWRGMLQVHSGLIARLDAELEREHGLPLTSYEVLLHLANSDTGTLRMGELADRLFLSRSGLTRLVDRLVKAGLVEREVCESDRRGYFARLTDAGRERFDQARPTHLRGVREHFLSKLDPNDLDALARAWDKVGGAASDSSC